MIRRLPAATAFIVAALALSARAEKTTVKALEPTQAIKPAEGEGYFDEDFGLDDDGNRLAVIRGDGATFAKVETYDLGTTPPKLVSSFDLPNKMMLASRIELLAAGKGLVLIAHEKPDDSAPLYAFLFDSAGKPVAKVGPATAFARPPTAPRVPASWSRSIASSVDTVPRPPTRSPHLPSPRWRLPASRARTTPTSRAGSRPRPSA